MSANIQYGPITAFDAMAAKLNSKVAARSCCIGLLFLVLVILALYLGYDWRQDTIAKETTALISSKLATSSVELTDVRTKLAVSKTNIEQLQKSLAESKTALATGVTSAQVNDLQTNIANINKDLATAKSQYENLLTRYNTLLSGRTEVFYMNDGAGNTRAKAADLCKSVGAVLATTDQLYNAYGNGANWCAYGHTQDHNGFPMQYPQHWCATSGLWLEGDANTAAGANCYGTKPLKDTNPKISKFNEQKWSMYDPAKDISETELSGVEISASYPGSSIGAIKTPIGRYTTSNKAACSALCQKYPNCSVSVYDSSTGKCDLLNDVNGTVVNKPNVTSTIRRFSTIKFATPATDTAINGGSDLVTVKVNSLEECIALAEANMYCSAFNYDIGSKSATLKSGALDKYTTVPTTGITSSKRVNW